MNYMKDILDHIKLRPTMIINECKLENLYAFMNGYMYRIYQAEDIIPEFYPGFQEFIEAAYEQGSGKHWTEIINYYSASEKDAFDKFFIHLMEYTKIDESSIKS